MRSDRLELLVADDSRTDYATFAKHLRGTGRFLVYLHNLHEIRAYNRLARMTSAPILAMLQVICEVFYERMVAQR